MEPSEIQTSDESAKQASEKVAKPRRKKLKLMIIVLIIAIGVGGAYMVYRLVSQPKDVELDKTVQEELNTGSCSDQDLLAIDKSLASASAYEFKAKILQQKSSCYVFRNEYREAITPLEELAQLHRDNNNETGEQDANDTIASLQESLDNADTTVEELETDEPLSM